MKSKALLFTLLFIISGILGSISSYVTAVTFGEFMTFEIFYLVFVLLSVVLALTALKIEKHIISSTLVYNIGFLVNSFMWSIYVARGTGQTLNYILTIVILLTGAAFLHAASGVDYARKLSRICSIVLGLCIIIVAVYNMMNGFDGENDFCIITQNVSLLSTLVLPYCQIKCQN